MVPKEFYRDLSAIWLVFGGSAVTHNNAPKAEPDLREKSLVDLLRTYLDIEITYPSKRKLYDDNQYVQITVILNLLRIWSEDLDIIYDIRMSNCFEIKLRQIAQRFLDRITNFEVCTVIPNGLISAGHTERCENVNLAILKKNNSQIDWIQVNPGSSYHQCCPSFAGEKRNVYLEILDVDIKNITEDWLYLLIGLKAVSPGEDFFYKDVSLYECLLAHLNGRTVFKSESDESFMFYSHTSPTNTWQVIEQSFRYLLKHMLGETYLLTYHWIITGFKIFLMEKTFMAFEDKSNKEIDQCQYLLHEMCRHVAQQAFAQGNLEQKCTSVTLIDKVKETIEKRCIQQDQQIFQTSLLNETRVQSLSFETPRLINHNPSTNKPTLLGLKADPMFIRISEQDDIIDYLKQFKNFTNKLINSDDLYDVVLLSCSIEEFLIEYLSKTDILKKSLSSFSKDDTYLAHSLKELAEIFFSCQSRFVTEYLLNTTYQPQIYAKNITIQFFVYAAVAALNFRDKNIGHLLLTRNLCTAANNELSLDKIIPYLVIDDARYVKLLLSINSFFIPDKKRNFIFLYNI